MKGKKILVMTLAVFIVETCTINGLPRVVLAQENVVQMVENYQQSGELEKETKDKATEIATMEAKKIYVKTLATQAGDGTEARPYKDFKTAYKVANSGDILVLLDSVTIQNDDNGSDQGVFTFNKAIKVEGLGKQSALNSRVPVQLGANVMLENIEFFAEKVYLNGYSLNMNMVKRNANNMKRPSVYGGAYQGTNKSGSKSILRIDGSVQNPFEFQSIYAGSETGQSNIAVSMEFNDGAKVIDAVNASGVVEKVNADVQFTVGKVNINRFENTHSTSNAKLHFKDYINTGGPVINGYSDAKLENSKITVKEANEFTGLSGKLEFVGQSKLDISNNIGVFTVKELVSENGSIVVLNKDSGTLEVQNTFEGSIELRTPGNDSQTSGPAKLGWTYLKTNRASTGTVVFKPHITQPNVEISENVTDTKNWVIKQKNVDKPIERLDVVEDKRINITETEHEFTLKALDKDGNPLEYTPQYEVQLKDTVGNLVSEDKVDIFYDDFSKKLFIYINDDTIQTGTYTAAIKEVISGKNFEIKFQFYNKGEQSLYTVVFHANHGIGTMENQEFIYDVEQELTTNAFTREGYTFVGWATSETGDVVYKDGEEVTNLTNHNGGTVNLYAKWKANEYDVKFDANGGVGTMANQSFSYDVEQELTTNAFTREGYTFEGWTTVANGTVEYTDKQAVNNLVAQDGGMITLYAVWSVNSYLVVFDSQQGTSVQGQKVTFDKLIIEPEAPTRDGYTFSGWFKEATCQNEWKFDIDKMPANNITLYAKWTLNDINENPVINATDKVLTVGANFNPLEGVTAHDKEEGDIILTEANIIANDVDTSVVGTYHVTYKVTDSKGASVEKTITVVVNPKIEELNHLPTINATDKVLTVGDSFNPLDEVTAYDNEDGDIILTDANIIANNVDTSKAGTYYVTFKVVDKNGAIVEKTITITIKDKDTNKPVIPEKPQKPNKPSDTIKPNKPSGQSGTPQTGDISRVGLFGSMFVGSSGLLTLLLGKRRKKK